MTGRESTVARLGPGEHCRITEDQWAERLESDPPAFHQWGSCFLVEEEGLVWLWARDVSGEGRHTAACLDVARSARAREGVMEVEAAARRVADLLTAARERGQSTLDEQRVEMRASEAFTELAEGLYKELTSFGQ
ncbi:MAG: hypothetical protein P8N09_00960 [Planctomycetota bacterium]|jgi:hypothetical protein|nr:hypothetical protein [Planctomycetota bacterium]